MNTSAASRTVSTDNRFFGVYSATVTDVIDDKGKEGRVKITSHWFDDSSASDWCRVAQIYAGNGYGAFILPEVGDEVLIAFDNGDMRAPVILAGLYNGKDKPATYRSSTQDQKLLRTKGGSELLFDDSQGKQRVRLKTPAGHTADLSDVDKKIVLQTSGGQSVTLDDSGTKITIQAGNGTVTIDGTTGNITVAGAQIVLQGSSISLGPTSSSTHPVPFGDLLLGIFNSHTHVCTAPGSPSGPPIPILPPNSVSLTTLTS